MYPCSSRQEIGGGAEESLKAMLYISYMNYSGQAGNWDIREKEVSWSSENSQVVERNSIFRKSDLQIE